ncbi:hypothetical protein F3Y22_tig00111582pilonHSYRG01003 [Hibiscus syriacus]|uniref:Uncharacterized protein n=1 Tax=Hibiscus syriacus TaxID=106335 RepID=A0A6A2YJQ9_HIBSY|nr:hypothetical protein F3Y22_tig00111582pilonHSYRG01003 [Hibiscus syriacus]
MFGQLLSSIPFLFLISISSSLVFYFFIGLLDEFGTFGERVSRSEFLHWTVGYRILVFVLLHLHARKNFPYVEFASVVAIRRAEMNGGGTVIFGNHSKGYVLHHFIDGTQTPPQPTVTVNGVTSPNPAYITWKRQDRLLFSALLGAISISLQPLIAHTTTSLDAWQTLANTYAKPSRGHIKQLKEQLKRCTKGSKSISECMQAIKTRTDELSLLGKPIDDEY